MLFRSDVADSLRKPKSSAVSESYTAINCSKKSSDAMILVRVEAVRSSSVAASVRAAFDGVNRDEYF